MSAPPRPSPPPPPIRSFNLDESISSDDEGSPRGAGRSSLPARLSFNRLQRPSLSFWRRSGSYDAETSPEDRRDALSPSDGRPPIPSALQQSNESNTTPLPVLPMIVLSIVLLGEFLTANVSMPFVLFMVEGFGEFPDEADVGFWTGILVATFFLTQFVTSLLWATVADRHGARLVLTIALLGGSLTCALFGTATNMRQAITIRLGQGLFAGAIGVARGCVTVITNTSNEGRAYAILGFCWGFGGAAGAIIGGTFESPALKWPSVFSKIPLFVKYPYLLPTLIASSITFIGAFLSLFLGPDGGPRHGSIRLPIEKDTVPGGARVPSTIPEESSAPPSPPMTPVPKQKGIYGSLRRVSRNFSSFLSNRSSDASFSEPVPLPSRRRTSRANGSAYGYSPAARTASFRARLTSGASYRRGTSSSMARRHNSGNIERPSFASNGSDLNFAQRLLMANENAVTNIADLWVAAAMNVDNEEVFESDDEATQASGLLEDEQEGFDWNAELERSSGLESPDAEYTPMRRDGATTDRRSPADLSAPTQAHRGSVISSASFQHGLRMNDERPRSVRRVSSDVPSIFSHPGVRTPQAVVDAHKFFETEDVFVTPSSAAVPEGDVEEKPPNVWSQLPLAIILQYGLLALHSTTHDMVFLSYLVSKYESGGLNLNAGHFSQLTALMCLFQVAYQFYLYPNIGPPRGRFSHLSMFRLGTVLFIPGYLTVTLYRIFASPEDDGNFILMAALAISTAVRYCGGTFGYTSISILLNYMSPPPLVGLANGIGQSAVSLARCLGPILGGYIWSVSVEGNPSGFYIPFFICAAICAAGLVHSLFIR